jgi:hypothetical protein
MLASKSFIFAAILCFPLCGFAQTESSKPTVDKSGFTLFNPTPSDQLREFYTDRPDVTESPYTVDAGHYQIEFSFVEYTHDRSDGVESNGFSVLPTNFKVGLLNNLDLQLILNPYQNILTHSDTVHARNDGFGDAEIRAKWNWWGNDGGATAGGVMPFIKLPTGVDGLSSHHVEGGVIFPLTVRELPGGFEIGTMAEFDFDRNAADDGYGLDFVHTITLDHTLGSEKLDGYVEFAGFAPIDTGATYLAFFDTGVTYLVKPNVQLDCGINIGLSERAPDFTVFAGMSIRI